MQRTLQALALQNHILGSFQALLPNEPLKLVAGIVEAVAAAKRALSSHPLPDPFQPSGEHPSRLQQRGILFTCSY